jgi:tRNA threonylcarbamoyladenosine biosynthesis protein TsaB
MRNDSEPVLTLAIESAIRGGSLSLLAGETELDRWVGDDKVSRAEELLPNIIRMLERQQLDRKEIDRIAVSVGPGSFTGIRIGMATALGLKNSLNVPCVGISALEALAASAEIVGRVMAALPVGRDLVCVQVFDVGLNGRPVALSEPEVRKSIPDDSPASIVSPASIRDILKIQPPKSQMAEVDDNLARLIGLAVVRKLGSESMEPMFVQPL